MDTKLKSYGVRLNDGELAYLRSLSKLECTTLSVIIRRAIEEYGKQRGFAPMGVFTLELEKQTEIKSEDICPSKES